MLFVAFLTWWNLISEMRTPYLFATVVFDSHWILCHYLPKLLAFRFCWQLLGGGAEVEVPPALYRITSDLFYPIYLSVQLQITKPLAVISVSGCVLSYGNDRSNWGMLFCLSESHHHSHLPLIPMWTNSQASSNRHFETLKTTVPYEVNTTYN